MWLFIASKKYIFSLFRDQGSSGRSRGQSGMENKNEKEQPLMHLYKIKDSYFVEPPKQSIQGERLFFLHEIFDSLKLNSSSSFHHFCAAAENHPLLVKIVYYGSSCGVVTANGKFIGVLHPHHFKEFVKYMKLDTKLDTKKQHIEATNLLFFPVGFLYSCLSELVLHPQCPSLG
jgi:hypothetical protein